MARTCTICTHANRLEIDKGLVAPNAESRGLVRTFDVSEDALRRHRDSHLPRLLAKVERAEQKQAVAVAAALAELESGPGPVGLRAR